MYRWVERVYEHSPVLLQHAMVSAYGWKLERLRYGGDFQRQLDELLRTQYYSETELSALQDEQLRSLLRHCYDNVPHYERLLREHNLTPDDFRTTSDLLKLPVLEKETVRANPELFLARNYRRAEGEVVGTSGTTGKTLRIRVDAHGRRRNYAFFTRLKHWAGIGRGARVATFGGRTLVPARVQSPPFWRFNAAANTLLLSSYHLSDHNLPAYLAKLADWAPELIDSYPSSIGTLAGFAVARGLVSATPKAVITSSETLREEQREAITRAFQTRVFDQYGSAEQVSFISQCERGRYHVHPEYGVTEFIPIPGARDGSCSIVATGFTNYGMPLLRYNMGDVAVPSSERGCE